MLTEGKQDCDSKYALEGIYWGALLVERKKKEVAHDKSMDTVLISPSLNLN